MKKSRQSLLQQLRNKNV